MLGSADGVNSQTSSGGQKRVQENKWMISIDYLDKKIEEADGRREESQLVVDEDAELDSARIDLELDQIMVPSADSALKSKSINFGAPQAPSSSYLPASSQSGSGSIKGLYGNDLSIHSKTKSNNVAAKGLGRTHSAMSLVKSDISAADSEA